MEPRESSESTPRTYESSTGSRDRGMRQPWAFRSDVPNARPRQMQLQRSINQPLKALICCRSRGTSCRGDDAAITPSHAFLYLARIPHNRDRTTRDWPKCKRYTTSADGMLISTYGRSL